MVKMELKSSFLSGERRAELLKKSWHQENGRCFPPKLATPPFSGAGTSWRKLSRLDHFRQGGRPSRCFDTRRNETAVVVVIPAAAWRLSAQTKSWPKLNDLNRLDLRILQKQNTNTSVKHSFQRNPQEQKIPFGYGDSFRSPLWLLSCRPLFQGQLSWRYPASTSVPCARWTGESRAFCLGRNSHFVEMVRKVICWNQSASLLA